MSIIRKIQGREALPVWALPYVLYNGLEVLVGFETALQSLANKTYGRIVPPFLTAYKLNECGGYVAISPIEWKRYLDYVAIITKGLKASEEYEYQKYPIWVDDVAKSLPTQAFLFLDELSNWYYEFTRKNVSEGDGCVYVLYETPRGSELKKIPYRQENYAMSLDPIIDEKVRDKHRAWFIEKPEQPAMSELGPPQNADRATLEAEKASTTEKPEAQPPESTANQPAAQVSEPRKPDEKAGAEPQGEAGSAVLGEAEASTADSAERPNTEESQPPADFRPDTLEPRAINGAENERPQKSVILKKAALFEALTDLVKDGVNLDSVFSSAARSGLSECKAESGREWNKMCVIGFLARKGYLKQEYMDKFGKLGLDEFFRRLDDKS